MRTTPSETRNEEAIASEMRRTPSETKRLLPGLPDELALLCLARLPLRVQARCRCVSHAFFHALRPEARRQELDVAKETWILLCIAQEDDFDEEYRTTMGPIHWFLLDPLYPHCSALPSPPTWSPDGYYSSLQALPLSPLHTKVLFHGLYMNPIPDNTPPSYDLLGFDMLDRQWCSGAPPMIHKDRCNFASATLDGYLYVAGGNPHDVYGDVYPTAERFNLTSEIWECLPDMHEKRHACSGFAMDGCFYVVGGLYENGNALLSGEFFDPKTGMWTLLPEMWPSRIASPEWVWEPPAVAMVNHDLYALKYMSAELFWYDKQRREWVSLGDFSSEWEVTSDHQQLLGMGDELWILSPNQEGLIQVFSCKPQAGCSTLKWQTLSFQLGLNSIRHRVLACSPIEL